MGREWNLFGRLGARTRGDGSFDRALTLGFEHGGRAWGRAKDSVGLAMGGLKTDRAWRDATAADPALVGYAASGTEWIGELYYRAKLNEHLEITPDYQLIRRPGGDAAARAAQLIGLRANVAF